MSGIGNWTSVAHAGTRISALVPTPWEMSEVVDHHVRFFAPPAAQYDNHRSTFSISLGEPEGFGPDGFQEFCDASRARLEASLPDFSLRSVERFTLSSFVDIHAVWYSCGSDTGHAFAQLQALGLMDRYHLYLINAATLLPLADEYLPIFDTILHSLRMLPSR